jgi:hypothetical protein
MRVGHVISASRTGAGWKAFAAHFEPSFFSTALRLLPADLTASFDVGFRGTGLAGFVLHFVVLATRHAGAILLGV